MKVLFNSRMAFLLYCCLGIGAVMPDTVLAQWKAERSFSDSFITPGKIYTVRITITGPTEPSALTVIETPPKGWTIRRPPTGGTEADGVITVSLPDFSGSGSFSYTMIAPADATEDGVFSGNVNGVEIGGAIAIYLPRAIPGLQAPMRTATFYDYLLYTPLNYASDGPGAPLLIFLHGAGERGTNMDLVKTHGPPKLVGTTANATQFPGLFQCLIVSPQCPAGDWWRNEPLKELLDELRQTYKIDSSRIYISGLSMGGYGTWSFISQNPEIFAAAIPIAGAKDASKLAGFTPNVPAAQVENLVTIPIWAFHGMSDTTVPFKDGKALVDALVAMGGNVKYTFYPGVGHDCWTQTYNNADVWTWLFSQRNQTKVWGWEIY